MIYALLTEFRNRYPTGSLTADLLTLHNDRYVVRAQVQINGSILATGLAAASGIEAAEDQARIRALQALGLGQEGGIHPTLPVDISKPIIDAREPVLDQAASVIEDPIALSPLPKPKAGVALPANHSAGLVKNKPAEVEKPADPITLKSQTDSSINQAEILRAPNNYLESPTEDSPPPKAAKPGPIQPDTLDISQGPVDLSDIIAQTDVELRRLGWTSAQGREYLEQTYQKRSRQQLSDEELLAFLLFLESQPSPKESQI